MTDAARHIQPASELRKEDGNPYAPPATISAEPVAKPIHVSRRSAVLFGLVSVAALCYTGFTMLLLRGPGMDRESGFLFLINVPVLVFWLAGIFLARRFTVVAGGVAAVVQAYIMLDMLYQGIGDVGIVIPVNVGIIVGFLFLALLCRQSQRGIWPFATSQIR